MLTVGPPKHSESGPHMMLRDQETSGLKLTPQITIEAVVGRVVCSMGTPSQRTTLGREIPGTEIHIYSQILGGGFGEQTCIQGKIKRCGARFLCEDLT